jgi:hypothetical protein
VLHEGLQRGGEVGRGIGGMEVMLYEVLKGIGMGVGVGVGLTAWHYIGSRYRYGVGRGTEGVVVVVHEGLQGVGMGRRGTEGVVVAK